MADELDLERDVVGGAVRRVYQDFRVAMTGVVGTFARSTSRAVVRLMVRFTGMDMKPHEEPDVPDAPVIYPSGDGYGFWFDLAENDPVVALAQDAPPYGFYETGSKVTDKTGISHTYGCAVAFPGGRVSNSDSPTDPPNAPGEAVVGGGDLSAAVTFRRAGGPSPAELGTVVISAAGPTASIKAGGDAAAVPVACAPLVEANLLALNAAIQAWVPVPNDGGASLKPVILAWKNALQSMADAKLVVEGPAPGP